MSEPGHDLAVAFADVVVPGDGFDLTGWECWAHPGAGGTTHYARGPCPACHAVTQGAIEEAAHPIEALGDEVIPDRQAEPVEVPVRCTCGHDHGRAGASGCGRRWSIICPRQQP